MSAKWILNSFFSTRDWRVNKQLKESVQYLPWEVVVVVKNRHLFCVRCIPCLELNLRWKKKTRSEKNFGPQILTSGLVPYIWLAHVERGYKNICSSGWTFPLCFELINSSHTFSQKLIKTEGHLCVSFICSLLDWKFVDVARLMVVILEWIARLQCYPPKAPRWKDR